LDEIVEASVEELAAIDGVGGEEAARQLRAHAEAAMERRRSERVEAAASGEALLADRDWLRLISGVTPRMVEQLASAGYRTLESIASETDVDKLAIRTGLGARKAQELLEGVAEFLRNLESRVEAGQDIARRKHQEEQSVTAEAVAVPEPSPEPATSEGAEG